MAEMPNYGCLLIHYADIALKGRNRARFEAMLRDTVRHRFDRADLKWPLRRQGGRLLASITDPAQLETALEILDQIPGIATYVPAIRIDPKQANLRNRLTIEKVTPALLSLAEKLWRPDGAFAVRVHRHHCKTVVSSQDLEREWGAAIMERTSWSRVDLSQPDRTFHIGIYPDGVYLFSERFKGIGGMPVGASGRALTLLSGGIDSPVAAWMMARRGCMINFLHFTTNYMQQRQVTKSIVGKLVSRLSLYTQSSKLIVVPYLPFELALAGPRTGYETMLFRRFMLRVGAHIARQTGAQALVTGDSLSQVASQTMENLASLDQAVSTPIFRPLLAFNKQEIIRRAEEIGTYRLSIQPYKDCCALLSRSPKTRSSAHRLAALEDAKIPAYQRLIEESLGDASVVEFADGAQISESRPYAGPPSEDKTTASASRIPESASDPLATGYEG